MWGPSALGLYDRSYRLMMFPLQNVNAPLGRVVFPILSQLQDEPERFRRSYLMILRVIMFATVPAIAVAGATSDRLIPFLLGERWSEAAPIFAWLSLTALLQPVSNATGWLFTSLGRGGALMKWGAFATCVLVAAFCVGVQRGPVGVAAAYFFAVAGLVPLLFFWACRGTPVRTLDMYRLCIPPFVAAAITWAGVALVRDQLAMGPLLALSLVSAYALTLLTHWADPSARQDIGYLGGMVVAWIRQKVGTKGYALARLGHIFRFR
jgi:PST family polysaccharide transporter